MSRTLCLLVGTLLIGSVQASEWIGPADGNAQAQSRNLEQLMRQYPLGAAENSRATRLFQNERSANLLVQIRDREPLHYHADSDITVLLLRGYGVIQFADKTLAVKTGDVMHIPRGVVHAFINQGTEIAAALVVYSPAPGPNDRVLAEPIK
jgi:quercetin dioxygenase-like cupin family protein